MWAPPLRARSAHRLGELAAGDQLTEGENRRMLDKCLRAIDRKAS